MKVTETQEHRVVVDYLRKVGFDGDVIWTHIRGERASATDGLRAKKMGVNPGLPDFLFIHKHCHLWIELKARGFHNKKKYNEHEVAQLYIHQRLRTNGDYVVICETLGEVINTLREGFDFPIRTESITSERIRRGMQNELEKIETEK